jgi:hypothetical protein
MANFFSGVVFLIKVVYDMVMCIMYALFRRNDIVFIHVVLGQTKMASAKNGWDALQILRAVKRIEALNMSKCLHPGYFFLGIH